MTLHPPARKQTVWLPIPGCPHRHLRVEYITEGDYGPDSFEETTTASEAGLVLDALSAHRLRRVDFAFTRPSDL